MIKAIGQNNVVLIHSDAFIPPLIFRARPLIRLRHNKVGSFSFNLSVINIRHEQAVQVELGNVCK